MSQTISASEFQRNIGKYVSEAVAGERIHVMAHGRPTVVIVSAREYESLLAASRHVKWHGDNGAGAPQS